MRQFLAVAILGAALAVTASAAFANDGDGRHDFRVSANTFTVTGQSETSSMSVQFDHPDMNRNSDK